MSPPQGGDRGLRQARRFSTDWFFIFPRTVDKSFKLFTALRAEPPKASNVEIDAASIKIGRCLRGALALYCFVSARAGSMAHTYKTQVLGGAFRIFSGTSLGV